MINDTLQATVQNTVQTAENYFNLVIVAIVILLVGLALGILAKKLVHRFLKELQVNQSRARVGITIDLESGISTLASYIIYIITVVLFLDQLKIRTFVIYGVVVGLLLLFLLSFAVGIRNIFPNFKGWLKIRKDVKMKVGKKINVNGISGIVEKIKIQETILKTKRGDLLRVPNSLWKK